jgi:hypothetical protein
MTTAPAPTMAQSPTSIPGIAHPNYFAQFNRLAGPVLAIPMAVVICGRCATQHDLVLDPFLGWDKSSPQPKGMALCHGLKLDPLHIDFILRRYQAMAGTAAAEFGDDARELTRGHFLPLLSDPRTANVATKQRSTQIQLQYKTENLCAQDSALIHTIGKV